MQVTSRCLLADRGYDADAIVDQPQEQRMFAVVPPKRKLKKLGGCDKVLKLSTRSGRMLSLT
jgi:hypothetical protein